MKKFIFGLSAIAIIITGIFTFAGCEKEESTDIRPVAIASAVGECPTCSETNISLDSLVYVQNRYFIDNYGIDIHEFSSNANFQQLITEINEMTSDISDFMANADPAQLEASRLFLERKTEELQMYEEADNTAGMLSVTEEIFAAVMPDKPMNAYTYGNHTYQLPVDYMETKTEALSDAVHQLEDLYPSLQDMPCTDYQTLLQISFIASEIDGNNGLCYAKQEPPKPSEQQIANCMDQAKTSYNWCYAGAVAVAAAGLISCTGTTFIAALCMSGVIASYALNIGACLESYNLRVELCRHKGSY